MAYSAPNPISEGTLTPSPGHPPADRSLPPVPFRWLLRGACFLPGAFALIVGAHDAFQASAGYQLLGAILVILGVAACTAVLPIPPRALWTLLIAVSAALAISLTLFLGAALNISPQRDVRLFFSLNWRLILWAGVLVIVASSTFVMFRALLPSGLSSIGALKPLALIPSIGGAGAVVAAVAHFVYATQLAPLASSPSFGVQAELHEVGRSSNLVAISGSVKVHNASDARVSVLSSIYRVEAFKFDPRAPIPETDWNSSLEKDAAEGFNGSTVSRLTVNSSRNALVQAGRIMPQAWTFDKGEDYTRTFIAYVPNDYNVAQLTVEIAGAKDSVLQLDVRNWQRIDDSPVHDSGSVMGIVESSWYQRFTQPPRLVADRWYFGEGQSAKNDPSFPTIDACVYFDQAPNCGAGSERFLGLVQTSTQYEMWVKPAPPAP